MSPPLKIALISEHASPLADPGGVDAGGQNIYVDQVARALADAGHRVDVLTRRDDPRLPSVVTPRRRVRVVHVDAGPPVPVPKEQLLTHMPAFAAEARRWLAPDGPLAGTGPVDVLHANFFMSGWVGLLLRRRLLRPLVTTFHALGLVRREHQGADDHFPDERVAIERRLAQTSDAVIAECPQDGRDLLRLYDTPADRIREVPCGVDTLLFRPGDRGASRRRLGLPASAFVVLQLGRLVPRKGIDDVVRAVARLPSGGGVRLVVVGGEAPVPDERLTPEIARLRRVARDAGVGDRVTFVGRRDRDALRDWYVAADVFVTTPWYEPFGITPLEAMACGTPVVGSAVGGIAHTVLDGVTGLLVPPRDPDALAAALHRLRADPDLAAALGRRGVQRVRTHFTWDAVADRLAEVYREVAVRGDEPAESLPVPPSFGRSAGAGGWHVASGTGSQR